MPNAVAPTEWYIGRMCSEFNCLPSAALRELETDPLRLADTIMTLRSYASLKEAVDRRLGGSKEEIADSPLLRAVMRNTERIVLEKQ